MSTIKSINKAQNKKPVAILHLNYEAGHEYIFEGPAKEVHASPPAQALKKKALAGATKEEVQIMSMRLGRKIETGGSLSLILGFTGYAQAAKIGTALAPREPFLVELRYEIEGIAQTTTYRLEPARMDIRAEVPWHYNESKRNDLRSTKALQGMEELDARADANLAGEFIQQAQEEHVPTARTQLTTLKALLKKKREESARATTPPDKLEEEELPNFSEEEMIDKEEVHTHTHTHTDIRRNIKVTLRKCRA